MFTVKKFLCLLLLMLFAASYALAEIPDIFVLEPTAGPLESSSYIIPMYKGPTVQYEEMDISLDPSKPYVFFGQSTSWMMVAIGTPDDYTNAGWIEGAALTLPLEPDLSFADRLPAMVEETADITFSPYETEPIGQLAEGTMVDILARDGSFLYIECPFGDTYIRCFIRESAIE